MEHFGTNFGTILGWIWDRFHLVLVLSRHRYFKFSALTWTKHSTRRKESTSIKILRTTLRGALKANGAQRRVEKRRRHGFRTRAEKNLIEKRCRGKKDSRQLPGRSHTTSPMQPQDGPGRPRTTQDAPKGKHANFSMVLSRFLSYPDCEKDRLGGVLSASWHFLDVPRTLTRRPPCSPKTAQDDPRRRTTPQCVKMMIFHSCYIFF